jgi:protein-disulfide isomerase
MKTRLVAVLAACVAFAVVIAVALAEPGRSAQGVLLTRQTDGSMVLADKSSDAPVLDIYEDFDCPVCKELHTRANATILRLARAGEVKVVFHQVTIFQQEPMRSNSIRAAAAARCVPEPNWLAFRDELYAMQPEPHGEASGFSLPDLVTAARKAGASVDECVTSQSYAQAHLTASATAKIDGTPTVLLGGQPLGNAAFDPTDLQNAITGGPGTSV